MNATYRKYQTKNGFKYSKNGKFTKKDSINPNILAILEQQDELVDQGRWCLFCGDSSKLCRLVNDQLVYICDKHYYDKNTGQIASKLRELADEGHEQQEEHKEAEGEA